MGNFHWFQGVWGSYSSCKIFISVWGKVLWEKSTKVWLKNAPDWKKKYKNLAKKCTTLHLTSHLTFFVLFFGWNLCFPWFFQSHAIKSWSQLYTTVTRLHIFKNHKQGGCMLTLSGLYVAGFVGETPFPSETTSKQQLTYNTNAKTATSQIIQLLCTGGGGELPPNLWNSPPLQEIVTGWLKIAPVLWWVTDRFTTCATFHYSTNDNNKTTACAKIEWSQNFSNYCESFGCLTTVSFWLTLFG